MASEFVGMNTLFYYSASDYYLSFWCVLYSFYKVLDLNEISVNFAIWNFQVLYSVIYFAFSLYASRSFAKCVYVFPSLVQFCLVCLCFSFTRLVLLSIQVSKLYSAFCLNFLRTKKIVFLKADFFIFNQRFHSIK